MVKPCRKTSYYSENNPQFFKIYIPDHCSQRLRIPPAFIKYFKDVIPFKFILKNPAKRSWHVDVNKVDNYFFFENGWQEFVQLNSLKFGDFLVFSYNGNSEFDVGVFGKNNCEKQLPLLQKNQTSPDSEETCTRMIVHSRSPKPIQENIEPPCKFASKNPFFEGVLWPTYVRNGFMHIPAEFANRYMCRNTRTATLECSNKSWVVNLVRHQNKLLFSRGWAHFVAANALQEGEVCSFELITTTNDYVFNVAIRKPNEQGTKSTRPQNVAKMTPNRGVQLGNRENIGAFDNTGKFISNYPFFQIDLTPGVKSCINIPAEFRHRNMYKRRTSARLQHSNKWWRVKLTGDGRRRLYFTGGWHKFMKESDLQAGDSCRFELIEIEDGYVFNVSISKKYDKRI